MELDQAVDRHVLASTAELHSAYRGAKPFPYVVIDDFLAQPFAQRLLDQFPSFERGNSVGDDGKIGNKATFEKIRSLGQAYAALDDLIKSRAFLNLIEAITGVPDLIYDPFYLGGGTHENRHGQSLQAHIDFNYHPSEGWHRRLNLIVYLNHDWDARWGGNLELYADPYKDKQPQASVAPVFNRCVIFGTSEKSWHAFDPIKLPADNLGASRKSIALYFYSRERPQDEIAGKHTTHYVNAQIPEHIRAGHTLTQDDVDQLNEITTGRDRLLQHLYEENAHLRQAQDRGLTGAILFALRRLYVRLRR
jgi:Rps23 Pro-64 3,4-dihydroxylase Tpa1-like proline 4-hydroxylase